MSMARENMARDALGLAADFYFTIIDGPPQAETISRSCIVASDLVVVPIEPGGASRWSSDLTVRQLKEAQELKPNLKCGFVVSRKIGATVLGRDTRTMAADAGIPTFETEIEQRVAYAEALTMGKTIFEWSGRGPAVIDIQNLTHELLDTLNEQEIRTCPEVIAAFERGGAGQDTQTHISTKVEKREPVKMEQAEPTRRLSIDLPESLHRRL